MNASEEIRHRLIRRCANLFGCFPYQNGRLVIASGRGAYLQDVNGKRYVDLVNAFGSLMLGHADPDVSSAASEAIASGIPASGHAIAAELAERIAGDVDRPDVRVAFFKSGTEALRSVVLAARQASGRRLIVSAGFHGWDGVWVRAAVPLEPSREGVYDCLYLTEPLRSFVEDHRNEIAAAVIAPDYIHLEAERLRELFGICREHGVMTIADDVKYGYRLGTGSSIASLGIEADAYVFAKGLANGWPVASVVGPPALLDEMALHCSTLSYDAPSLAASAATLAKLARVGAQAAIAREGERFLDQARALLAHSRLPLELAGRGCSFQFIAGTDELETALCENALLEGLVLSPSDNQLPSYGFTGAAVRDALAALARAMESLSVRFRSLLDTPVSPEARLRAAWRQMDGLPTAACPPEQLDALLRVQTTAAEGLAC